MKTENQMEIPSLKKFIFPTEKIRKMVVDLELYYQLSNQASVKLYSKWKGKDYFKGTFGQAMQLHEAKELFDLSLGKSWQSLITSIYLIKNYNTDVSLDGFHKLDAIGKRDVVELINDGQIAHEKLLKWLEPINKKNVLDAIYDAVKVTLGEDEYSLFQILKFSEIDSIESDGVVIHENILEIDNPSALVEYLKSQKEPIKDSLILTFMRNKKYEFKPTIYIFFIWKKTFYVLDMGERRLNLENTAGVRNPTRFYEAFDEVWLPLDIIFSSKKRTTSSEITVRNQKVFKRGNLFEIFKKKPEIKAWLDMFIYRIIDYIERPKKPIPIGVTSYQIQKQLEDKSEKKIPERIITNKHYSSFESQNDASSYLLKKYESKITSVIPSDIKVPMLIGTKKFLEGVVKYKQRQMIAKNLQKLVRQDYNRNHKRVYKWFDKFVRKASVKTMLEKGLEDKEYSFKYYVTSFGSDTKNEKQYVQGLLIKIDKKKELQKRKLLTVYDGRYDHIPHLWGDDPREIVLTKNNSFYIDYPKRHPCISCKKVQWSILIRLQFIDYRQLCEFFTIKPDELPHEFVEHFHYQNETHVGNSILDDTDPMDEINDFWFRDNNQGWGSNVTVNDYSSGHPELDIFILICKRCLKKLGYKGDVRKNEC